MSDMLWVCRKNKLLKSRGCIDLSLTYIRCHMCVYRGYKRHKRGQTSTACLHACLLSRYNIEWEKSIHWRVNTECFAALYCLIFMLYVFFVYINEDILQQIHIGKNWCIKKITKLQVKKCLMLEICKGRTPNKTYAMFSLHILFVGVQSHSFILNISHCIQFSINNWFILSSLLYLFFKPHDTFQVVFSF